MKTRFRAFAKIALVLVYLVIAAGAIVRMTGSGMGCPDWPKCFGYYIPPTEEADLQFKPNHFYIKGIVIIVDESLKVAKRDFTSESTIDLSNWNDYTKHDYAIFNAIHTWVEYINRLLGALSGIPILIFTVLSIWLWKDKKRYLILSLLVVFGMAFQAWLGKTVVDSNLAPFKITTHMVMALIIVALILYLIFISRSLPRSYRYNKNVDLVLTLAIALSLIQIILGTQVRQFVDIQNKTFGYNYWDITFSAPVVCYVHRSLSILVTLLNLWLFYRIKKLGLGFSKYRLVILCLALEIATGIAMYYFDFPFSSQPIHLLIATILVGIQFYVYLEVRASKPSLREEGVI
ncbi:MAG: COX15/CtaA family protein [Bacteroidota bacterium]